MDKLETNKKRQTDIEMGYITKETPEEKMENKDKETR